MPHSSFIVKRNIVSERIPTPMYQTIITKRSKQFLVWLSLAVLVSTICVFASTGVASAHTLRPTTTPTSCQHVLNANYSESCVVPTIPPSSCGPNQYRGTLDSYQIPVNVTLTDEVHTCVNVNYTLHGSGNYYSCDFYFYIPAGSIATAIFPYTWQDAAGKHTGTINEDTSIAGWNNLFSSSSATLLSFTDHDSPAYRNLSWGSSPAHSLEIFCS